VPQYTQCEHAARVDATAVSALGVPLPQWVKGGRVDHIAGASGIPLTAEVPG